MCACYFSRIFCQRNLSDSIWGALAALVTADVNWNGWDTWTCCEGHDLWRSGFSCRIVEYLQHMQRSWCTWRAIAEVPSFPSSFRPCYKTCRATQDQCQQCQETEVRFRCNKHTVLWLVETFFSRIYNFCALILFYMCSKSSVLSFGSFTMMNFEMFALYFLIDYWSC